ncbi:MAG: TonB-dependent receptor [Alteromonadaceae bacterium]|nr:TonB-dependent receptor [Alteromonadaceae bacterium]
MTRTSSPSNSHTFYLNPLRQLSKTGLAVFAALHLTPSFAQEAEGVEVIEVRGFKNSLKESMLNKKAADVVSDGISAEDLGKFPDQNVAESLQRITGVAIDRSGGEGQFITVRGFGPQFNTVLVNGRQIATENQGREFSFDTLPAELISGADVYKSPVASMQEGGIGATVNVTTAKPFDFEGFAGAASAKGMYEELSEEITPQVSGLVTNRFLDDRLGLLFAASYQERKAQNNTLQSNYWRPNVSLTNRSERDNPAYADSAQFNGVYIPQNYDQRVDFAHRQRTSGNLVMQYALQDNMILKVDGLYSKFEVDSSATSVGHWLSDSNLDNLVFNENGSVVSLDSTLVDGVGGATDFISSSFSRNVEIKAYGINLDWNVTDYLTANFDISTSKAENASGGANNFNVVGYNNAYSIDYSGSVPVITIDGGDAALQDFAAGRLHVANREGFDVEDTIDEMRADFTWLPDSNNAFAKMEFGVYYQDRQKQNNSVSSSLCSIYCGYQYDIPDSLLSIFTAENFFPQASQQWITYDPEAYFEYAISDEAVQQISEASGQTPEEVRALIDAESINNPAIGSNSFSVQEEVLSVYSQLYFSMLISDMPVDINFGLRFSQTDTSVGGYGRELLDVLPIPNDPSDYSDVYATDEGVPISESNSYSNILPNINARMELTDDLMLRVGFSETLTRPTMSDMVPAFNVTVTRPGNLQAESGNARLKPFLSTNMDLSLEWYYADTSYLAVAAFTKEVEDFIVATVETQTLNLQSGQYDFNVRLPGNGETADVNGLELAWLHTFENGFGIQANATVVNSDASLDASDTTQVFALEGLGDSQNLILFYEQGPLQARVAYNNREAFMQDLVSPLGGTEPRFTKTYGQVDVSASYDINESFTVFFEGINVTGETLSRHGRYEEQFVQLIDDGARYTLGVRTSF